MASPARRRSAGDGGDGVAGGGAGADQGGGAGSGPVAVSEQVQAGFGIRPGAGDGDVAVGVAELERGQVAKSGAESGAPDDRVAGLVGAVGPGDAGGSEAAEHGAGVRAPRSRAARTGGTMTMSPRPATPPGSGSPRSRAVRRRVAVSNSARAVDVVGQEAGRPAGDPGGVGDVGQVGEDLGGGVAAADDDDPLPGERRGGFGTRRRAVGGRESPGGRAGGVATGAGRADHVVGVPGSLVGFDVQGPVAGFVPRGRARVGGWGAGSGVRSRSGSRRRVRWSGYPALG